MTPCVQPFVDDLVMLASQVHCTRTASRQTGCGYEDRVEHPTVGNSVGS